MPSQEGIHLQEVGHSDRARHERRGISCVKDFSIALTGSFEKTENRRFLVPCLWIPVFTGMTVGLAIVKTFLSCLRRKVSICRDMMLVHFS